MIDGELGAFLRSRREAVDPADLGLPVGPRRRTPGLRRAEVATLAGVSVDYLIRLEQGRDSRPSTHVLAALADVLRLSEADRDHLQQLAVISHGTELMCPSKPAAARAVRPTVHALLELLEPAPAYVVNRLEDLLAWNDGYDSLARPLGILDAPDPNLLAYTFADERSRAAYPDWDDIADEQVATLHRLRCGDPATGLLAARLAEAGGAGFTDRWERRPLHGTPGVRAVAHPEVGLLRLACETLELPDQEHQRLVVHLPADAATSRGLDRLAGRQPGGLRSVTAG